MIIMKINKIKTINYYFKTQRYFRKVSQEHYLKVLELLRNLSERTTRGKPQGCLNDKTFF